MSVVLTFQETGVFYEIRGVLCCIGFFVKYCDRELFIWFQMNSEYTQNRGAALSTDFQVFSE